MRDGQRTLWLASRSTRRRQLLEAAGLSFRVVSTTIDDGALCPPDGVTAEAWAMALAYLKARAAVEVLAARAASGVVLGADTICAVDGRIVGQPRDERHAQRTLELLRERDHRTISGVALVDVASGRRRLFVDAAVVRVGAIDDEIIAAYVRSGGWRGKAGGYNLDERLAEGWPIEVEGDRTTVVGLPMRRLRRALDPSTPA